MTTTPPPQAIQTPSTPLHGAKYDTYQPYVTRKSTRSSTQRVARTPSPVSLDRTSNTKSLSRLKKVSLVQPTVHTYSPPSSSQTSPQKKKNSTKARKLGGKTSPNDLDYDRQISSLSAEPESSSCMLNPMTTLSAAMLPTPAKTPRKKATKPGVNAAARVLFPIKPETVEDAMPTPRKNGRRKKHAGFSLDGFGGDDDGSEEKIEIFTDSKDKVPEIDDTEDNPFYVKPGQATPPNRDTGVRSSKRRKVSNGPKYSEEIEESFKREDGMVYVFRGKKVFRKFEDINQDQDECQTGLLSGTWDGGDLGDLSPRLNVSTIRSPIKPRLLFPTEEQRRARQPPPDPVAVDEEAVTDIEDPSHALDSEMTDLAPDTEEEALITPVKTSFLPTSPPTTGRTTRATTRKAALDSSPSGPEPVEFPRYEAKKGKKSSPFDGWQRGKAGAMDARKGKKREGDLMERDVEGTKKMKSNGI